MVVNGRLNTTNVPRELRLILELLKCENSHQVTAINPDLFKDIDWELFIKQTKHHRIYPFLYSKIKGTDENMIPPNVIKDVSYEYKRNTFQMLHLSGQMEQLNQKFSEHQIKLLFLKGPVLAHDLYGDLSLRTSSDLDVLIPMDDLARTEQLLVSLGYKKDDYIQGVLSDWKWRHHHVTYFHPEQGVKVEVHWRLNPGPAKEPSFHELWERKRNITFTNQPVYLLSKEDLFLFLASHGARHGWSRLRWLVDIQQLMRQKVKWEDVSRLIKKYHYRHVGVQATILATQLLNTPLIKEIETTSKGEKLAQEAVFYLESMINLHNEPLSEEVASYHKRHLFSLMSIQQKLFFILSFLYPYPEDVATLPLPEKLHLLYFPLRPFLWGWRKTRKQVYPGRV
ncbi:nucleotidyltransferase domain-containing protein [Halobacillus amylolyticus]|uniref:Nucleotidyltransferase family protein n=1 Tax=Halobacillus amylolyticus TaxID=2932259 RepID=A0ABY4HGL8_9BACI|nr:nucleotidyltransferase family protein [Halobacillus amylolyticus]UOR13774.1 nucleotidyltransferase family protein [Halobacillus amylolyticus]